MSLLFRHKYLAVLPLVVICAPISQAGELDDAVDYRQAAMGVFSWNTGQMAAMVKGEIPFDVGAFAGYAKDLAASTSLNVLAGFPEDSVSDDSDAKDEIWLDWSDFEAKFRDLQAQSTKLADVAAVGNEATIKAQFDETRAACKACHKAYKK